MPDQPDDVRDVAEEPLAVFTYFMAFGRAFGPKVQGLAPAFAT